MNFFEADVFASSPAQSDASRLTPQDEDLLMGAASSSDPREAGEFTVEGLVVTASAQPNFYDSDELNLTYDLSSGLSYEDYSWSKVEECIQYGMNAYTVDQSPMAQALTGLARDALQRLFLASQSTQGTVDGPGSETLTMGELAIFRNVFITIGAHGNANAAFTQPYPDGSSNIFIDPNRLGDKIAEWGIEKGLNYVIYHELAHALADARHWDSVPGDAKEQLANEYGQIMAEITGAIYPSDYELQVVKGTMDR